MKVVFLLPHLRPGGAETQTIHIADGLIGRGIETQVWLFDDARASPELSVDPGGVPVQRLPARRARESTQDRIFFSPGPAVRALRKMLRDERPDVLVSRLLSSHLIASIASLGLSVRHVAYEDLDPGMHYTVIRLGQVKREITGYVYRRLREGLAAPTEDIAERAMRAYRLQQRPHVIPLMLPHARTAPRPSDYARPALCACNGTRAVLVSSLTARKNPDAAVRLLASVGGTCLTVFGDGPQRTELQRHATSRNITLHMAGWVRSAQSYLPHFDVLLHSSRTESVGLAMAEALSGGIPVVTRHTTGAAYLQRLVPSGIHWWPDGDDANSLRWPPKVPEHAEVVQLQQELCEQRVVTGWLEWLR